jgi:uncharacterized protein YukE
MSDVINVDYALMEELATDCLAIASRLEHTADFVAHATTILQASAMAGAAGETFAEAQRMLVSQTQQISEKFKEMSKGIQGAIADMQAQDRQASARFR